MTLLQPAALAFLALAPIVIALYLLKVRRRPVPVSTLLFWQRALAEQRRRALFQRLRRWLSLLLQLLIFALLLLALARPEFFGFTGAAADGATVLILDGRARMQALEANGESRFVRARTLALAHARRASARRPVALLILDGPTPRVLAPFSSDDNALVAALDAARPTDAGGGRIEDALGLAEGLLATRTGAHEILVLTDQPRHRAAARAQSATQVRVLPVAGSETRENVAITRLVVRPLPASPQTVAVFLELLNAGTRRQTGEVELAFDGRVFDVRPFDLAPGEKRVETNPALPARPGAGTPANARGWLTAHLRVRDKDGGSDALALDDNAYAVLPAPRPLRVLLVTRGNWFLENLLRAATGDIEFQQLAPDAFAPALAASFDAVILDDYLPNTGFTSLDDLPAAGNFLFIRRAPPSTAATDAPSVVLERPPVTDLDPASPLLRLVDWRSVGILRAVPFSTLEESSASSRSASQQETDPGKWRLLAPVRSAERPLVLSGERTPPSPSPAAARRQQRLVALAFGLAESDLPLRVAFPLFMSNTLRWLAGRDSGDIATAVSMRAGETLRLAADETLFTRPQRVGDDNGAILRPLPEPWPAAETLRGPAAFQPLQNGFYLLRRPDGDRWLAVNTDDPKMAQLNSAELPGADAASAAAEANRGAPDFLLSNQRWIELARGWPPWVWLAVGAFLFSTVEWWLFHRRRTE